MLFINNTYNCEIVTAWLPNKQTTNCLKELMTHKHVQKVVLIIHGFLKSFETRWLHQFQRDIMRTDPGTVVIVRRANAVEKLTYFAIAKMGSLVCRYLEYNQPSRQSLFTRQGTFCK